LNRIPLLLGRTLRRTKPGKGTEGRGSHSLRMGTWGKRGERGKGLEGRTIRALGRGCLKKLGKLGYVLLGKKRIFLITPLKGKGRREKRG